MRRKHLLLATAALLAAVGLWLGRTAWRTHASRESSTGVGLETTNGRPEPGQANDSRPQHAPPDQTRKFREMTPEQRVQQARKGHGPGG